MQSLVWAQSFDLCNVRKILPRSCGGSLSFGNWGLLDLLGTTKRETVKTIALYQSLQCCNFGKVSFPAGVVRTHFIVNSEKTMKHLSIKLSGDMMVGRWISKFICLRECRLKCLYLGVNEENTVWVYAEGCYGRLFFKGTDYWFQAQQNNSFHIYCVMHLGSEWMPVNGCLWMDSWINEWIQCPAA